MATATVPLGHENGVESNAGLSNHSTPSTRQSRETERRRRRRKQKKSQKSSQVHEDAGGNGDLEEVADLQQVVFLHFLSLVRVSLSCVRLGLLIFE